MRTPRGVLPDGLPSEVPMAESIVFHTTEDGELVRVFAIRPVVDMENVDLAHDERTIEIVAAFSMSKAAFETNLRHWLKRCACWEERP